jgi:5-methylcytosine-specific restriction endonuclease McrA
MDAIPRRLRRICANQFKRKLRLLREDRHCKYCGKRLNRYTATIDHVIPLSKGGKDSKKNRVLACYECNQEKGDKILTGKERE